MAERPWNTNHSGYREIFCAALTGICANPAFFGAGFQGDPSAAIQFADKIVIAAARSETEPTNLDRAWRAVDALGGTYPETDAYECGYAAGHSKALDDALAEIEKLGGRPS